jgi:hypothetical protein
MVNIVTMDELSPLVDELKSLSTIVKSLQMRDMTKVYTNESLALMLGVSKRTLQNYRDKGLIYYSKVERQIFYRQEDVDNFLLTHSNAPFQHGKAHLTLKHKKS